MIGKMIAASIIIFTLCIGINSICVDADTVMPEATPIVTAVPPEPETMSPVSTSVPTAVPTEAVTEAPVQSPTPSVEPSIQPVPAVTPSVSNKALRINKKSLVLGLGQVYKLKIEDCKETVIWNSSNKKTVTVTKDGKIKAYACGNSKITAIVGTKKYTCKVKVNDIGIEYSEYVMEKGEVLRLHFNGLNENIKWNSSNSSVASVKDGKVTALKKGNAVIKISVGRKIYTCNVSVTSASKGVIYLTFDDGPSLTSTPKILDILKKNEVHATFFTIGYDKAGENFIKREAEEGHTVAIHGSTHDYAKIYKSKEAYLKNITDQQKRLKKTLGYNVWITRFPGGSSNLVSRRYCSGIMRTLVKEVDKAGFSYFDWNVSSGDAGGVRSSAQVYSNVTKSLRNDRENVVLMHDFSNNNYTIGALDSIIKYGKSHGYTFKTITNSTKQVHHNVQN